MLNFSTASETAVTSAAVAAAAVAQEVLRRVTAAFVVNDDGEKPHKRLFFGSLGWIFKMLNPEGEFKS